MRQKKPDFLGGRVSQYISLINNKLEFRFKLLKVFILSLSQNPDNLDIA
jgi:hypothetical protein